MALRHNADGYLVPRESKQALLTRLEREFRGLPVRQLAQLYEDVWGRFRPHGVVMLVTRAWQSWRADQPEGR